MSIFTYIKRHSVITVIIAIVVVIAAVIMGRVSSRNNQTSTDAGSGARQVSVVDVSLFRNGTSTVRTDGTVESVSQVDLKSQISAPLSRLNVTLGQYVSAGQVLLELQNADTRAQLDQAKAALALALGQYGTGGVSVESAKKSAIDTVRESYLAADDAIRSKVDQFLFNSQAGESSLSSYISDYKLADRIQGTRTDLTQYFTDWRKAVDGLSQASSDADIHNALTLSKKVLDVASGLLDDISLVLNDAVKNAPASTVSILNGWKAIVSAARASVSGASASVTGGEAALSAALSSHGSPAEAQVSVAEAGIKNLEAQLEKTIVRSPISGKVAALPLRSGELASPGALLATVVGQGGLEVKAYISGEDFSRVNKGSAALIQGSVLGSVLSIAPSVNQANRKVEVKIIVSDTDSSKLVIGQNVSVAIEAVVPPASTGVSASISYVLPIQNVKIVPGDASVFTVGPDSKVVKHHVILGGVTGDFIEVKSGLSEGMKIISPVYELEEGQVVEVR